MQLIIQTKVQVTSRKLENTLSAKVRVYERTYSREYRQFLLYRGFCFIAALTYLAIDLNILCRVNTAIK